MAEPIKKKVLNWDLIKTWCNGMFSPIGHTHDNVYVKIGEVDAIPVGTIVQSYYPLEGFIVCNGANISRTAHSRLFALIGTDFGEGDELTTFTLPSLTAASSYILADVGVCTNGEWGNSSITVSVNGTKFRCKVSRQGALAIAIPAALRQGILTLKITKVSSTAEFPERVGLHSEYGVVVNGDGYTSYKFSGGSTLVSNLSISDLTATWITAVSTAASNNYFGIWANEGTSYDVYIEATFKTSSGVIYDLVSLSGMSASAGYDGYKQNHNASAAKWVPRTILKYYIKE